MTHQTKAAERRAVLYEIITRKTMDESMAQRCRTAAKTHIANVNYQTSGIRHQAGNNDLTDRNNLSGIIAFIGPSKLHWQRCN